MELNQALVKMEQGGSTDGILQVRADRIQSDLEGLLKALAERCKKHGVDVKSTAVIELPQGWQPGVPEISAVWDDWDKFEDEGFQFDVVVPGNAKSTSQAENLSSMDNISQDSYSNADGKSDKPFDADSAYPHSEDESAKSPASSPRTQKIFETPTKEDSFSHFGKSFDADTERYRVNSDYGTDLSLFSLHAFVLCAIQRVPTTSFRGKILTFFFLVWETEFIFFDYEL